jgi:hypothetical protein
LERTKNPLSLKCTEAKCGPDYYYNHKGAWMDREIFKTWFQKSGFPQRERVTTESGVAAGQCTCSAKRAY